MALKRGMAAALALSCALLLTGCSSLLENPYAVVEPHTERPATAEDSSAVQAGTYSELVNTVLFFVSQGTEKGLIQLTDDYDGDVEEDLNRACLEVAKDDPLGAYAVDFIKNDCTKVLTTYEATITISYRRTREQVSAIVAATGATAIRSQLKDLLSSFGTEAALRISYFEGDETYIQTLFREAYYASPDTALDLPEAQVYIYPQGEESGRQRIVEVLLTYHLEQKELQRRRTALARRANEIVVSIWGTEGDEAIQTVSAAVLDAGHYDPEGGGSAYDALVAGAADSEGLALAALLLAQRLELTGMVVPWTGHPTSGTSSAPRAAIAIWTSPGGRTAAGSTPSSLTGRWPPWATSGIPRRSPPAGSRRTARRGRRRFPAPPPPPPTGRNEIILNFFILCLTATNFLL